MGSPRSIAVVGVFRVAHLAHLSKIRKPSELHSDPRNSTPVSFTLNIMISRLEWIIDPHSGGRPISNQLRLEIKHRLQQYADTHHKGRFERLDITFRKQFCYLGFFRPIPPPDYEPFRMTFDEYIEHIKTHPIKMCRLRHFDTERWSCSFFTYSSETYKPCILPSGEFFGTVEDGFEIGASHFQ